MNLPIRFLIAGTFLCATSMAFAVEKAFTYHIYIKNQSAENLDIQYLGADHSFAAKATDFVEFPKGDSVGHAKTHDKVMTVNYPGGTCTFYIHVHSGDAGITDLSANSKNSDCNAKFVIDDNDSFALGTLGDEPDVDKGSVVGDIEEAEKGAKLRLTISDK